MTLNEVNKKIDLETSLCIEQKFDWWQFKGRKSYEPRCRTEATAKYQKELDAALLENQILQKNINSKFNTGNTEIIITIVIAVIILIIFYFYIPN